MRAATIRAAIKARRHREQLLPADLFADPAWDMLLDLMAASIEGRKVYVSSLCAATVVPYSTALRWIGVLVERGLVERSSDPEDRRRVYLELSEAGARAMGEWFDAAALSLPIAA